MSILSTIMRRLSPSPRRERTVLPIRARFDAAAAGGENARHWSFADFKSADADANYDIRRTLRARCRYEVQNNSYARGMVLTLANDTIGCGPRLQVISGKQATSSTIEYEFGQWAERIDFAGKLRTMRMARCQDGEAFLVLVDNPALDGPVKLDIDLVEADRVCDNGMEPVPGRVDGIQLDEYGNPVFYRIHTYHPGTDEIGADVMEYKDVPARHVVHYFRVDRPGQHRGVPEITPALDLFAQLRRFTLAVLSAAEAAADFAGILYTDSPAGGESEDLASMDEVELRRNMLITMPGGWKMGQLDPKQPCSTYGEFKGQILNEISRCLNMPFNIACGNSSGYNYASGRLDHMTYYKALKVEQAAIATKVLDRVFSAWLAEYRLTDPSAPQDVPAHSWFWDGFEHVDPVKEANATDVRLANHTTTYAAEFAKQGRDWEDELEQVAKEKRRMAKLGITQEDVTDVVAKKTRSK